MVFYSPHGHFKYQHTGEVVVLRFNDVINEKFAKIKSTPLRWMIVKLKKDKQILQKI